MRTTPLIDERSPWAIHMADWGRLSHFDKASPTHVENTRWNKVGLKPGLGAPMLVFKTTSPDIKEGC